MKLLMTASLILIFSSGPSGQINKAYQQQQKVICFKDNCECWCNGEYKYEYDKEWDGYTCGCNSDHKYWVEKKKK